MSGQEFSTGAISVGGIADYCMTIDYTGTVNAYHQGTLLWSKSLKNI
jgi:hypothetical protein